MESTTPNSFVNIIEVKEKDLDQMQHVNNVRYLQWVQDIAEAHWNYLADPEMQEKFAWVVLSHHIAYKAPAFLGDKIKIKTHVEKSSGVTSVRIVEMYEMKSQRLLVRAETNWCLLLKKTLKPFRIPKEVIALFHPGSMV
jgi:acyl-CoA thioester hydrolase